METKPIDKEMREFCYFKGEFQRLRKSSAHTSFKIHVHFSPGRAVTDESGLANYIFWINLCKHHQPSDIVNMS